VEPRDIIPDKQIYHVGDVMRPKVKMHCGCCLDPGLVDWAVYTSKDGITWTQTCAISHPWGDCGWAEGYSYLDACGSDGIPVTSNMIGTLYIGVANCFYPCATTINSNSDPNAIVASHTVTIKAAYQNGYGGLTIVTEPSGASVWLDGSFIGQTPIDDYQTIMGQHEISVVKDGYPPVSNTVTIPNGGQIVKSYKLSSGDWWSTLVDYAPYIIGGAAGVVALVLIIKARQKRMERMR
jgi:hypothetical protein